MTSEETFAAPFDPRFIIPGLSGISQEIEGSNRPVHLSSPSFRSMDDGK